MGKSDSTGSPSAHKAGHSSGKHKEHKEKKEKKDKKDKKDKKEHKEHKEHRKDLKSSRNCRGVEPITEDDYFLKMPEFMLWLKATGSSFEALQAGEARRAFKGQFCKAFNRGKLPASYYSGRVDRDSLKDVGGRTCCPFILIYPSV